MSRNRLYLLLGFGLLAGYGWIIWSRLQSLNHKIFTPCLFKNTTGIACPSCGTTRAVLLLFQGNFTEALLLNPLGILMGLIMIIAPFWLLYDIILKKDTILTNYYKAENIIKTKWVAITLIIIVLINWAWNIQKGL